MEQIKQFRQRPTAERKMLASTVREKYRDRIPVFVDRATSKDPHSKKCKYIIEATTTFGALMAVIRKQVIVPAGAALFIYTLNHHMIPVSSLIITVYNDFKSDDGFLYVLYTMENTFGGPSPINDK